MELQDFVDSDRRYDTNQIAADEELTRQIQQRLNELGLLDPPIDGIFGPVSTSALERFQRLLDCGEPGFLGSETAKKLLNASKEELSASNLTLKVVKDTVFKAKPIDSSALEDSEKQSVAAGNEFELVAYEQSRSKHFRVTFRNESFLDSKVWYAFGGHVELYAGSDRIHPKPKSASVKLSIPYKSQLDNYYNPTGACNVTSLAMCLEYLQIPRKSNYGQYEDELYEYAINRGYSRHQPEDLAQIVRDYGARDNFVISGTIEDAKDWVADEKPAVVHGYFTQFGHIVVLAGYDDKGFFVHDPYGEWFPGGYRTDLSGKYVHYSYNLIRRTCMPDGDLWTHFISK
ncbi:C39 family peptidase [Geitlerinema sp. PCC 9228]|uniref:C39 family peptidase n=1 Tax=Geitlerinema sp. PCC 9228 TaxID=111611 RepID=UPI0008F9AEC1|nr:C39 family peptidase [Geitlerinema sp. PCC 9228]